MSPIISILLAFAALALAICVPLLAGRALQRVRTESLAPAPEFIPVEPVVEAPSRDPERLGFEEAVARMLDRYPVSMLDRSRLAGEIEHHWQQHVAGVATWATAFAAVEAWVRRQTQIERPLTQRQIQTLRDPRPHVAGSARRSAYLMSRDEQLAAAREERAHRQSEQRQILHPGDLALAANGDDETDAAADRVAIAGVRDLIEFRIKNPLPGTLADRVQHWALRTNPALAGVMDLIEDRNPDPLPGTVAWLVQEWAETRALQLVDDINALTATDKAA